MLSHDEKELVKEEAFCGLSHDYKGIFSVSPLTIKEILEMNKMKYESHLALLLLTEVEIAKMIKEKTGEEPDLKNIQPLSFLLQSATVDDAFLLELTDCFHTFIKEDILLLPRINSVLVGPPEQKRLITNDNFADLQEILCIQNGRPVKEGPPENESAIAREFRLKREYREAVKKKQQEKKGGTQTFSDALEIAAVYGFDYMNSTLYAFYRKIKRFQAKEQWESNIRMICAGADPKEVKPKYWGENLDKD